MKINLLSSFLLLTIFFLTENINAQNVGVGTETPSDKLEVSDDGSTNIRVTSTNGSGAGLNLQNIGASDWRIFNGGGSLFFSRGDLDVFMPSRVVFREDGRIGFGDTTPDTDFEFQAGSSKAELRITAPNLASHSQLDLMSGVDNFATYHWRMANDNASDLVFQYGRNEFAVDSFEAMRILNQNGFIGMGTSDPQRHLVVSGTGDQLIRAQTGSFGSTMTGIEMVRGGVDWRIVNDGGILKIFDGNNNFSSDGDENFRMMSSGNIGLGATNPLTKIHIQGGTDSNIGTGGYITLGSISGQNISLDNNEIQSRSNGSAGNFSLQHSGGDLHLVNGGGRVGIGTNNPISGVHILDKDLRMQDAGNVNAIFLDHNGSGGGGEIDLYNEAGTLMIEIEASEATNQGAEINMRRNDGTASIILDADFEGNGRIQTDELRIIGGSDLSEHFDITGADELALEAGMLVSIDPNNPGQLMLTNEAYDSKVAGVISGANGIATGLMMGQDGSIADGDWPIALTGRVYVKADASHGAIAPGDLLTSSGKPGFVMKASDNVKRNGAVIGKAMTSLESGEGFVLILVSLQ